MCGIVGYWNFACNESRDALRENITNMTNVMFKREPDGGGAWIDVSRSLALGARRPASRDASPSGFHPMTGGDERYVLAYTGKIYNVLELEQDMRARGCSRKGVSDAEALLWACMTYGPEKAVRNIAGTFAFALWDAAKEELFLARDRFGIKPLYWGFQGRTLFWSSELKALRAHSHWVDDISRESLAAMLHFYAVPAPLSIFTGINKLAPASFVKIDRCGNAVRESYWRALDGVLYGQDNPLRDSADAVADSLDALLSDAVARRLTADAPVGAFLSGGIDSSLIVALMQKMHDKPVPTFSIGIRDQDFDEAPFAKAIAEHLGTDHTEVYLEERRLLDFLPKIPYAYDEPFADSSQIPTSLASSVAGEKITVALAGDGGDELFAGYAAYSKFSDLWIKPHRRTPAFLQGLAPLFPSPGTMRSLLRAFPEQYLPKHWAERLHRYFIWLCGERSAYFHTYFRAGIWYPETLVVGGKHNPRLMRYEDKNSKKITNLLAFMQYADSMHYLPNVLLPKVGKAGAAVSLEVRAPFLDERVYDFSCRIPASDRMDGARGKLPLRNVLKRYIPEELFERPKQGFGIPVARWLRGPLREWADSLLDTKRLENEGFFQAAQVGTIWAKHCANASDWQATLWPILMFQAWLDALPSLSHSTPRPIPIQEAQSSARRGI